MSLLAIAVLLLWEVGEEVLIEDSDLGEIATPPGEAKYLSQTHTWAPPKDRGRYSLTYRLGNNAAGDVQADHIALDRGFHRGRFWRPETMSITRCRNDYWRCAYNEIAQQNAEELEALLARVAGFVAAQDWDALKTTRWLLRFVQEIEYRVPEDQAFGVLPPPLVLAEGWGDCDSKSLLLVMMLQRVGIDAQIFVSNAHAHALVGVQLPPVGEHVKYNGKTYVWAESTSKAPLGWIHPKFKQPFDWAPKALRFSS
ncbi:MAG: transglutaminase domain-containing protein [Pseudomonadota bacterium]